MRLPNHPSGPIPRPQPMAQDYAPAKPSKAPEQDVIDLTEPDEDFWHLSAPSEVVQSVVRDMEQMTGVLMVLSMMQLNAAASKAVRHLQADMLSAKNDLDDILKRI